MRSKSVKILICVFAVFLASPSVSRGIYRFTYSNAPTPLPPIKITYCPELTKKISSVTQNAARKEEIKMLQDFLSQFPGMYPERAVNGAFDIPTKEALKKFQKMYKIATSEANGLGTIGPKTRNKIANMCGKVKAASAPVAAVSLVAANGLPKIAQGVVVRKNPDDLTVKISYYDFFGKKPMVQELNIAREPGDQVEKISIAEDKIKKDAAVWDDISVGANISVSSGKNKVIRIIGFR